MFNVIIMNIIVHEIINNHMVKDIYTMQNIYMGISYSQYPNYINTSHTPYLPIETNESNI